jgi:hypothetical protein
MVRRILERLFGLARPETLLELMRRRRPASTSKLYVLKVDFQIKTEARVEIDQALDPIRTKFGIDFIVLEPGITLKRFDDF